MYMSSFFVLSIPRWAGSALITSSNISTSAEWKWYLGKPDLLILFLLQAWTRKGFELSMVQISPSDPGIQTSQAAQGHSNVAGCVGHPFPGCWEVLHDRDPHFSAGWDLSAHSFQCTSLSSSAAQNLPHHKQPCAGFHKAQCQLYTGYFNYLTNDKFISNTVSDCLA